MLFAEDEWYAKNRYLADTEGLELASIDAVVDASASSPEVDVTVYKTFKDGSSIDRHTLIIFENGAWKHRLTGEEIGIFEPGVPYEGFASNNSTSAAADVSANP